MWKSFLCKNTYKIGRFSSTRVPRVRFAARPAPACCRYSCIPASKRAQCPLHSKTLRPKFLYGFYAVGCFCRFSCLSAMRKNTKPRAKKIARHPTAVLMEPPASLTAASTAEPKNDAPLQKIS